ncbi:MAG: tetratricopeptide repeat protein [Planctomycetota bacterium]|jgi:tetratricopeptide (TPR) repeat protein|nr:tetratricopeptide repeat protein [Planctomycetota bacterium]MDP6761477.1 tetratricopeptide repeat protein [Planctomycetota bacterium]MDP6989439.1 tetratricopeptide repeat protein [Planctomycetota bacterium]
MPPQLEDRPLPALLRVLAGLRLWKPARLVRDARDRLRSGDTVEARLLLEEAVSRAPAWAEPLYLLSRCARLERNGGDAPGSRDEEEGLLFAALARDAAHAPAERAMLEIRAWRFEPLTKAWHLFHAGRHAEALAAFHASAACIGGRLPEESRADAQAGIGWSLYGLARHDEAVTALERATELAPELAHAHKGLGMSLYFLGRHEEAESALARAVELEPRLADARAFIGWCAYDRGDFVRAQEAFEAAREANPLLGDARWGAAWCAWRLDEVDAATIAFREAAALDPSHPSAADVAVWVLGDARFSMLAEHWAQLVAPAPPGAARPLSPADTGRFPRRPLVEAMALLCDGRPEDSLALLERVRPVNAVERWRSHLLEGRARLALDERELALEAFLAAVEIAPSRAESALAAADLLAEGGEPARARALLETAHACERDHPELMAALERDEAAAGVGA